MMWNQPIVLGIDGLGTEYLEKTGSDSLKQRWHSETDLRGYFDVTDPKDFVKSVEVWSSIIRGKKLAKFAKDFQYEYVINGLRIRFPNSLGKWAENKSYEESPLLEPLYRLNFLRDTGFFVEALWAYRWKKEDTIFANADACNVEDMIAYNHRYSVGCQSRRLMGDYLYASSKYRQAVQKAKDKHGLGDIYDILEKTPTQLIKRGKLRRLKRRREVLREKFESHAWTVFTETRDNFLETLKAGETSGDKSRIDFAYFNNIDSMLHLFRDTELIQKLYSETVRLYDDTNQIAIEQDRPLLIVSDHGMGMIGNAIGHAKRGFFSANYTFDEMRENLDVSPAAERRFYDGMPAPEDVGRLMRAHLTYKKRKTETSETKV